MEPDTNHIEISIDYPVSVEAILNVSFSHDGFKTIFDFILTVLRRHESLIHKQNLKGSSLSDELAQIKQDLEKTSTSVRSLDSITESHSRILDTHEAAQENLNKDLGTAKSVIQNLEDSQKDVLSSLSSLQKTQKNMQNQLSEIDNLSQNLEAASNSQKKKIENHDLSLEAILEKLGKIEDDLSKSLRSLEQVKKDQDLCNQNVEKQERSLADASSKIDRQAGTLNDHEKRIHQLEVDIDQAMSAIKSLGGEVMQISKPVEPVIQEVSAPVDSSALNSVFDSLSDIKKQIKEIDFRLSNNEDLAGKAKEQSEKNDFSIRKVENDLSDLQDYLKKIEELLKKTSGNQINLSELKSDVSKDDLDAIKKSVRNLEENLRSKASNEDLEALRKHIKALEEALKRKASLDDLDSLRHVPGQPVMTDMKAIRDLQQKIEDIYKQIQDLHGKLNEPRSGSDPKALKDLNLKVEDLSKQLSSISQRLDEQGSRISSFEVSLNKKANKSDLDDLKKMFSSLDFKSSKGEEPSDSSKLLSLYKRLAIIEDSFKHLALPEGQDIISIFNILIKFRDDSKDLFAKLDKSLKDTLARLKEIEDLLTRKASNEDLKALEEFFKQKLREIAEEFMRKFAEKIETKRALKYLEKQVREHETFKIIPEGDDAMLAKKPLGGWSCASCQKELEKLMGKVAPYQPWNKMPYRDPADRIARAGPGFSRMLASIQPESLTNRTKTSVIRNSSPPIEEEVEEVSLPPLKKAERPLTTL